MRPRRPPRTYVTSCRPLERSPFEASSRGGARGGASGGMSGDGGGGEGGGGDAGSGGGLTGGDGGRDGGSMGGAGGGGGLCAFGQIVNPRADCMHPSWRCLLLGTNVALGAGDGANMPPRCASMSLEKFAALAGTTCSVGSTWIRCRGHVPSCGRWATQPFSVASRYSSVADLYPPFGKLHLGPQKTERNTTRPITLCSYSTISTKNVCLPCSSTFYNHT